MRVGTACPLTCRASINTHTHQLPWHPLTCLSYWLLLLLLSLPIFADTSQLCDSFIPAVVVVILPIAHYRSCNHNHHLSVVCCLLLSLSLSCFLCLSVSVGQSHTIAAAATAVAQLIIDISCRPLLYFFLFLCRHRSASAAAAAQCPSVTNYCCPFDCLLPSVCSVSTLKLKNCVCLSLR